MHISIYRSKNILLLISAMQLQSHWSNSILYFIVWNVSHHHSQTCLCISYWAIWYMRAFDLAALICSSSLTVDSSSILERRISDYFLKTSISTICRFLHFYDRELKSCGLLKSRLLKYLVLNLDGVQWQPIQLLFNTQCQNYILALLEFSICRILHTYHAFAPGSKVAVFSTHPCSSSTAPFQSFQCNCVGLLQALLLVSYYVVTITGSSIPGGLKQRFSTRSTQFFFFVSSLERHYYSSYQLSVICCHSGNVHIK